MADNNTHLFNKQVPNPISVEEILEKVYLSLKEKGYDPVDQMVGYILSGDPSYITSHNNARNVIGRIERDDLVEELIKAYLDK